MNDSFTKLAEHYFTALNEGLPTSVPGTGSKLDAVKKAGLRAIAGMKPGDSRRDIVMQLAAQDSEDEQFRSAAMGALLSSKEDAENVRALMDLPPEAKDALKELEADSETKPNVYSSMA